jgi:hypothetical protein
MPSQEAKARQQMPEGEAAYQVQTTLLVCSALQQPASQTRFGSVPDAATDSAFFVLMTWLLPALQHHHVVWRMTLDCTWEQKVGHQTNDPVPSGKKIGNQSYEK